MLNRSPSSLDNPESKTPSFTLSDIQTRINRAKEIGEQKIRPAMLNMKKQNRIFTPITMGLGLGGMLAILIIFSLMLKRYRNSIVADQVTCPGIALSSLCGLPSDSPMLRNISAPCSNSTIQDWCDSTSMIQPIQAAEGLCTILSFFMFLLGVVTHLQTKRKCFFEPKSIWSYTPDDKKYDYFYTSDERKEVRKITHEIKQSIPEHVIDMECLKEPVILIKKMEEVEKIIHTEAKQTIKIIKSLGIFSINPPPLVIDEITQYMIGPRTDPLYQAVVGKKKI